MEKTRRALPIGVRTPQGVKFRSYKKASRHSAMHKLANQARSERMDKLRVW